MKIEEGNFQTFDGLSLSYRFWLGNNFSHPVILIHGLHEHSARYDKIVKAIDLPEFSFFSFDLRGHGTSLGRRGFAHSINEFLLDINAFLEYIKAKYPQMPQGNLIWLGHSFGGLLASRFALDHPDKVKALVLSSPCFAIKSPIPYLEYILAELSCVFPKKDIGSAVVRESLSHDPNEWEMHRNDPLIHNRLGLKLLKDMLKIMPETVKRAEEFKNPLLMVLSGTDRVVHLKSSKQFYDKVSSLEKIIKIYPQFYHEILRESNSGEVYNVVRSFLKKYSNTKEN